MRWIGVWLRKYVKPLERGVKVDEAGVSVVVIVMMKR